MELGGCRGGNGWEAWEAPGWHPWVGEHHGTVPLEPRMDFLATRRALLGIRAGFEVQGMRLQDVFEALCHTVMELSVTGGSHGALTALNP